MANITAVCFVAPESKYNVSRFWKLPSAEKIVAELRCFAGDLNTMLTRFEVDDAKRFMLLFQIQEELDKEENAAHRQAFDRLITNFYRARLLHLQNKLLAEISIEDDEKKAKARMSTIKMLEDLGGILGLGASGTAERISGAPGQSNIAKALNPEEQKLQQERTFCLDLIKQCQAQGGVDLP